MGSYTGSIYAERSENSIQRFCTWFPIGIDIIGPKYLISSELFLDYVVNKFVCYNNGS